MLNLTRRLIAFRHASEALMTGDVTMLAATDSLLAFERSAGAETLLCVFNLAPEPLDWAPADPSRWRPVETVGAVDGWRFGGYAGLIATRI